jgi:hypothetical protein
MTYKYFEFFKELIVNGHIKNCEGCNDSEIKQLEDIFESPLPLVYSEFLSLAGKESPWHNAEGGNFYRGAEYMKSATKDLVKLYQDLGMSDLKIEDKIIPLWFHDGFAYLKLNEGENPPVFTFWGGPFARHFMSSDTFLGYIIRLIKDDLINNAKFNGESGWAINSKINVAANNDRIHPIRIFASKEFE